MTQYSRLNYIELTVGGVVVFVVGMYIHSWLGGFFSGSGLTMAFTAIVLMYVQSTR